MKRNYLLLALFLVVAFATLNIKQVNSKIVNPPAGNSGDPVNNQTCITGGCHVGTAQNSDPAVLSSFNIGTGNPSTPITSSFQYTPGQAYNIAMALTSATGRYGFQIVALTAGNAQAGTMATTPNSTTTQLNTLAGRQYMGHKSASGTKNWLFKWTAPASGTGAITFYYVYVTGNANSNPDAGDIIYKGSVTITEGAGTGIADISTKVADLNIYPNPITNNFGLSFNLIDANQVAAQLYTLDGKLVKELINEKMSGGAFNQQFDIAEFPAGIYLVKINVGDASVSKKIIKL